MKALLLSILYTLVFLVLGSAFNYAKAGSCDKELEARNNAEKAFDKNETASNKRAVGDTQDAYLKCTLSGDSENKDRRSVCKEKVDKATDAQNELSNSCEEISSKSDTGETQKTCLDVDAACSTSTRKEESSASLGMMASMFNVQYPKLDFNSTCMNADMTLSQWEKKEEAAKKELKEKKDKFEKIQEDSQKVLENSNKAKQKMEEKTHDLDEEFQKLQKQAEEAGDKEQAEAAKSARENESRLREIQSKNLAMTHAKAAKMQERAAMLATMTDALIQTDCLEKIQKFIKEMNGSKRGSIVSGGASSAFNSSSTGSTMAQSKWQACLTAAQGQRDATLTKYQGEIQTIDQEMSNLNEEYKSAQKTIQQNEQMNYKAAARRENDKATAQNIYQQRRQKLSTDYMASLQEAQNKNQQLQGQQQTLQSEMAQVSNELASLRANKPMGDKTHVSAKKASKALENAVVRAKEECGCDDNYQNNDDKDLGKRCKALKSMNDFLSKEFDSAKFKEKVEELKDGTD